MRQSVTPVSWPPCERGLSAKLTEGFRFQDSFPVVGILPSRAVPVPPPFDKGGCWTGILRVLRRRRAAEDSGPYGREDKLLCNDKTR